MTDLNVWCRLNYRKLRKVQVVTPDGGLPMPAIADLVCPVCHKPHTFCLTTDGPTPGMPPEFACPRKGVAARLPAVVGDWRTVKSAPAGAVSVWEVEDGFTTPGRA